MFQKGRGGTEENLVPARQTARGLRQEGVELWRGRRLFLSPLLLHQFPLLSWVYGNLQDFSQAALIYWECIDYLSMFHRLSI